MRNLRIRIQQFLFRNRDKGIPNLMLYIAIGSAVVTILDYVLGNYLLYSYLCFDKSLILQGQVWRLVTYVFTEYSTYGAITSVIFLYFFYNLGRHVEMRMGTLQFNLFYFSGVLMMDVFAMIFCPRGVNLYLIYGNMAWYLHLSILLMFVVTNPNAKFLILFIIPVSAWFMGLVYAGFVAFDILRFWILFPHNLFPLVGLLNFLLFAGRDVWNLFPFIRRRPKMPKKKKETGSIPFRGQKSSSGANGYNHRCTVCGRTDVSDPQLEFRYCSRCNGYFCYCEDHINNHTHVD